MILRLFFLLFFIIRLSIEGPPEDERAHVDFYSNSSILIQSAKNRNITLKTNGVGKIIVNGTDVSKLPSKKEFSSYLSRYETLEMNINLMENIHLKNEKSQDETGETMKTYRKRVEKILGEVKSLQNWEKDQSLANEKTRTEIENLQNTVEQIHRILEKDLCEENPCKHGGTCITQYAGFFCICPKEFEGDTCEMDVDECETSAKRCQNDGTCVNTVGGFECQCAKGFAGPSCNTAVSECTTKNDLCGDHGSCVNDASKTNGYTCTCDPGYQPSHDPNNPVCIDIDECHTNPCHPGVECLNLEGSFECKGCPPGYEMSGSSCKDIDECQRFEPCDKRVECINNQGSYQCTPCPEGFIGEPKTGCMENPDKCASIPCSGMATCKNTADNNYICICPDGYMGTAKGSEFQGCQNQTTSACFDNRCLNEAICRTTREDQFECECAGPWYGKYCELLSPCETGFYCENGGICKITETHLPYCECPKSYYGALCQIEEDECDRHFSNPNGTFSFNRGGWTKCQIIFNINWDKNMALEVNFTDYDGFNSEPDGATNCSRTTGKLEVFDGPAVNYHKLATFCGNQNDAYSPRINEPIKFSSTSAMFLFKGTSGKFDISWKVERKKCGYRTSAPEGTITIPDNKEDIACEWFIFAPATKVIQMTIPNLVMFSGESSQCDQNELTLHDGYFKNDEVLLERVCSNLEEPITRTTISSHLTVSFVSNLLQEQGLITVSGFNLNYKFVDPEFVCGQDFFNTGNQLEFSGRIRTPNFGGFYPPNINCFWSINTTYDRDMRIRFTFHELDILSDDSDDRDCSGDVLKIDSSDYDKPFKICDSRIPKPDFTMWASYIVLNFTTNDKNQGKGFDLEFNVDCSQSHIENGTFQTWNFPNGGFAGECTYNIIAKEDEIVTLDLLNWSEDDCYKGMEVEFHSDLSQGHFFGHPWRCLEFFNGLSVTGPLKIVIKQAEANKGLSFRYTTKEIGCGGLFLAENGTITSPGYPSPPSSHLHCVYQIQASVDESIVLTFDDIDIDGTMDCEDNRIEIYEEYDDKKRTGKLLKTVCGSVSLPPIHSKTPNLIIKLLTSSDHSGIGFSAKYKFVNSTTTCDRTYLASSGEVVFSQNTELFRKCEFHIRVPDHHIMRLTFVTMNFTSYTHLHIHNGRDRTAPAFPGMSSYLEYLPEMPLISHSDHVYMMLHSFQYIEADFKVLYEVVSKSCGGDIAESRGIIQTPQYPHPERRHLFCEWRITVPPGNKIQLDVEQLDFEYTGYSSINSLTIFEQYRKDWKVLNTLRSSTEPNKTTISDGNNIKVSYRQSGFPYQQKTSGFCAKFRTVCEGIILREMSGAIETPQNMNSCNWEIQVPVGNRIIVHFHHFVIANKGAYIMEGEKVKKNKFEVNIDDIDYAEVNSGGTITKTSKISQFNSSFVPITLKSRHNKLRLSFDPLAYVDKVSLTYQTIGCVGDIKEPQRIEVLREDLDPDSNRFECEYRITAPIGKKVSIKFNHFEENGLSDCKYSTNQTFYGIAFFMGSSNESGHPYFTACRTWDKIESHTNEIYIYMAYNKTHFSNSEKVFVNATVSFHDAEHDDNCGGVVQLSQLDERIIQNPPKPGVAIECTWKFETTPGHHLEFTLESFTSSSRISNADDCSNRSQRIYGGLKIYDSEEKSTNFCYNVSSPRIIQLDSTTAVLKYNSAAYESILKNEFVLKARSVCGGVMFAEETQQYEWFEQKEMGVCNITIKKKNESDERIFMDFVTYQSISKQSSLNSIKVYSDDVFKGVISTDTNSTHSYSAQNAIHLSVDHQSSEGHWGLLKYRSNQQGCYNYVQSDEGTITEPYSEMGGDIDCLYEIYNRRGNRVSFATESHNIPKTPHCAESYIEVRESNVSGKVLSRQCDPNNIDTTTFEAESLVVIVRYRQTPETKGDVVKFRGNYKRMGGGFTESRVILSPFNHKDSLFTWTISAGNGNDTKGIRVEVKKIKLQSGSYIDIFEVSDNLEKSGSPKRITHENVDDQAFVMYTSTVQITAKNIYEDDYIITWQPFNEKDQYKLNGFDCGYEDTATWEWQTLEVPRENGKSGYKSNVHCVWTIKSTDFSSVEFEMEELNLGDGDLCETDYVYFSKRWNLYEEPWTKTCSMSKSDSLKDLKSYEIYVHFVSDKDDTDNTGGFKLKYRLTCGSRQRIPRSKAYQYEITSPYYPLSSDKAETCEWYLYGASERQWTAQIVDMDIIEETPCSANNSLSITNDPRDQPALHCGNNKETFPNFTSPNSEFYINYKADASNRKGFKLLVTEILAECPAGTIHLTLENQSQMIYSPEHPAKIPISTDCDYVVAVPHGHRVMVTFDPHEFNLLNDRNNYTDLDYIELRDGPSEHSQLIGKYQGHEAPPTKFSSSNFIFMRLSTDSKLQIGGFAAKFEIARCGGSQTIYKLNEIYYITPPLEKDMKENVECIWVVHSPNTHFLEMRFEKLNIKHGPQCGDEYLIVYDGNTNGSLLYDEDCSEPKRFEWTRSSTSEITIKYTSKYDATAFMPGKRQQRFKIAAKLSESACGGDITDWYGRVKPPAAFKKMLQRVNCVWNFKATPGYVYVFQLLFRKKNYYSYDASKKKYCFPDLEVVEGTGVNYVKQTFCEDQHTAQMLTPNGQLIYNDVFSRESRATNNISSFDEFVVSYEKVAIENTSCSFVINASGTFNFNSNITINRLCQISIQKPEKYGTVNIQIDDFGFDFKYHPPCSKASFTLKSVGQTSFEDTYCDKSIRNRTLDFVYTNDLIDLLIYQNPEIGVKKNFAVKITFGECGGVIKSPMTFGNISSSKSMRCRWDFEAPEGQIIKLKVISMQIMKTRDCKIVKLMVREGKQDTQGLLHTYCHSSSSSDGDKLGDEFKIIRSKTRFLNIEYIQNLKFYDSEWVLEYTFIDERDECGFHSSELSGIIETPNYDVSDYKNNLKCLWDIHVPSGYHIALEYEEFNVEPSDNCTKDSLIFSEASQRSYWPQSDYELISNDEELTSYKPLCGVHTPKEKFESSTRRLILNFTTDEKTTSRGFRIKWEAKCGAILTRTEDTITSPNYPQGYSHEIEDCGYIIQANDTDIVSLKFEDLDLPNNVFSRPYRCMDDHISIVEIPTERVIYSICGNSEKPEPLSFRGPIGIILHKTHSFEKNKKNPKPYRGFKVIYQVYECGRSIHLDENKPSTYIFSPREPLLDKHDLNCIWNITTSPDRFLTYKLGEFDLDKSYNCETDFVEIFDQMNSSVSKFCGGRDDVVYQPVLIMSPNILVQLKTDAQNSGSGFRLKVTSTLGPKHGCGGVKWANDSWQYLSPPRDENGKYYNNLHCVWRILARHQDLSIQFKVNDVDIEPKIESSTKCLFDSLKIYDGPGTISSVLFGPICSAIFPKNSLNTTSHFAMVIFDTDNIDVGNGFNLSYTIRNDRCSKWLGGGINPKSYTFSTNISAENHHEKRCAYNVVSETNEPVIISFTKTNFPSCEDGYVEIKDYGEYGFCEHSECHEKRADFRSIKSCGNQTIMPFVSKSSMVQIHIVAKVLEKPAILKLTYQIYNSCNRTIDTSVYGSGRLTSPSYPREFDGKTDCTTRLGDSKNPKKSKKMLIAFQSHITNKAEFTIGNKENDPSLFFTKQELPTSYYSEGGDINITMKRSEEGKQKGYDATYFTVSEELDDGTIVFAENHEAHGVVTNIGYPYDYANSTTQVFTLRPPSQTPCVFLLETLQVGVRADCTSPSTDEYVEIEHRRFSLKLDECRKNKWPSKMPLMGGDESRVIKITFKSDNDPSNNGKGFKATWMCDAKFEDRYAW